MTVAPSSGFITTRAKIIQLHVRFNSIKDNHRDDLSRVDLAQLDQIMNELRVLPDCDGNDELRTQVLDLRFEVQTLKRLRDL